jgi:hypothetical protein
LSLGSQKYGFGIRDPGSRGQKAPNPGSATLLFGGILVFYCPPWLGLKSKRRGLLSMNLVETVSFRNWGCLSKIKIKSETILLLESFYTKKIT